MAYTLEVFLPEERFPVRTVAAERAPAVMSSIAKLFDDLPACERVQVSTEGALLFAVNRDGEVIAPLPG